MLVWAKRMGWGLAALLLVAAAAFASMVRVTLDPGSAAQSTSVEQPAPSAPAPVSVPGALLIPVQGVATEQLSDSWGQSRGGGTREHHAIDIMAPLGTPVLAAAPGSVEKIFESAAGGHTVYVRTSDGRTVHYYAHLDRYAVAEGARVGQGQVIGSVGATGSASGGAPHLHFEIKIMAPGERWYQGTNINPYPLLAAKPARE